MYVFENQPTYYNNQKQNLGHFSLKQVLQFSNLLARMKMKLGMHTYIVTMTKTTNNFRHSSLWRALPYTQEI